jgi:hypothetical protein
MIIKKRYKKASPYLTFEIINNYKKLTHEQILFSRRNRNWNEFDKLDEIAKLYVILRELKLYTNSIKP